jgi:hypothetical protein
MRGAGRLVPVSSGHQSFLHELGDILFESKTAWRSVLQAGAKSR